jgi:hypothetical protein
MTAPQQDPGEQPGIEQTATAAPVSEQPPAAAQAPPSLDDMSADEILDLLTSETPPQSEPTPSEESTPTAEEPAPQSTANPADEEPDDTDDTDPPAAQTGTKAPGRLSVRALPAEQQLETADALAMVRAGEAVDLLDALQKMRGTRQAPAPADPFDGQPQAKQEDTAPTPQDVAAIDKEIADLRAQRDDAKARYEDDEKDALTLKIEDAIIRRNDAKMEAAFRAQQEAASKQSFEAQYDSAVSELEAKFPDVLNEDAPFTKILGDRMDAARSRKAPELKDPRYILKLAEETADLLGIAKAAPATPTTPAKPSVSAPPPAPRRANGAAVAPAHPAANRPTQDEVLARIDQSSMAELLEALST